MKTLARTTALLALGLALLPLSARAEEFVPVIDIEMVPLFENYIVNNPDTQDALRELIAAGTTPNDNEDSLFGQKCAQAQGADVFNADGIYGYDDGPWSLAFKGAAGDPNLGAPATIPNIDAFPVDEIALNDSQSIRCLLLESIGWQKLEANLKIHSMLQDYVATVQSYVIENQLISRLAGATLEQDKSLNESQIRTADGNVITLSKPGYRTNKDQTDADITSANARLIAYQTTAAAGDQAGSLPILDAYRTDLARTVLVGTRVGSNPVNATLAEKVDMTGLYGANGVVANAGQVPGLFSVGGLSAGLNQNISALSAWRTVLATNPLGVATTLVDAAKSGADVAKDQSNTAYTEGGGFKQENCAPNAIDPFCAKPTLVSSGTIVASEVADAVKSGKTLAAQAAGKNPDAQPSSSAIMTSQNVFEQGGLGTVPTGGLDTVNANLFGQKIGEFYNAIQYGYWNVPMGMTRWAQATMLMIYDEMGDKPRAVANISTGNDSDIAVPSDTEPTVVPPEDQGIFTNLFPDINNNPY